MDPLFAESILSLQLRKHRRISFAQCGQPQVLAKLLRVYFAIIC